TFKYKSTVYIPKPSRKPKGQKWTTFTPPATPQRRRYRGRVLLRRLHLREALEKTSTGSKTFLITEYGKPFSDKGFGSKMRKWCDDAGLPKNLSCHGVRKAVGAHLADSGCSQHEIMSYHGHTAPQESEKYTRTANRKHMARNAAIKAGIGTTFARIDQSL
ncbi:MAG: tyrosine-type recombinase/integrase, partial [Paracoccaceae bacterium]